MAALTADTILLQRYHLISPVADRGLGETWEGVDARLEGRRVLVKVLDRCDDDARKAVLARLQEVRMFRHPGALAVTDHGVHDGRPFAVHDLPLAGSLATLLDRHRAGEVELPLEKIAALVARLAEVVHAGHDEPEALVHGALRPRAVIVPDDLDAGQMVLLDAGLRGLGADPAAPKESAAGALCLTPEQFAGEPIVPRSDTFALGLLLLEILRAPAVGVSAGPARYLGRADVPDAVWDLVLLATRIPVSERPSIEALARLLAPAWTAPPVAEPTAPLSIPVPPPPAVPVGPDAAVGAPAYASTPAFAAGHDVEPRSSIPPGGLLGAMPSLPMSTPSPFAPLAPPPAAEAIEFGERTVALDQAPDLAAYAAPPADPLGSTRTMAPRTEPDAVEFPEERTIVAFAARMQAVDEMLSTVQRALPAELDDVAARFRAQMAASKRRDETAPKPMSLAPPTRAAPAPAAPVVTEPPAKPTPVAMIVAVAAVALAALMYLLIRR